MAGWVFEGWGLAFTNQFLRSWILVFNKTFLVF
jgi:hypothetical protein